MMIWITCVGTYYLLDVNSISYIDRWEITWRYIQRKLNPLDKKCLKAMIETKTLTFKGY